VAHPRAAEALNRKDGMPATVKDSAAVGPDERAVGDVQADVASYGVLCPTPPAIDGRDHRHPLAAAAAGCDARPLAMFWSTQIARAI